MAFFCAIAAPYKDGFLKKPTGYLYAFPDLLTFHADPDYALWYGWSEMQRSLTEIKEMAADRRSKGKKKTK